MNPSRRGRERKFCSRECALDFRRKWPIFKECQFCGATLPGTRKAGRPQRYCNRKCAELLRNEKNKLARRATRNCKFCEKEFVTQGSRFKYCSVKCRENSNRNRSGEIWLRKKSRRPETKTWKCGWCDGDIELPIGFSGWGKYHDKCRVASDRARNRLKSVRRRGIRATPRVTHEQIGIKDNFVCYLCSEPIDMSLPRTSKLGATIDHVIPITKGGTDDLDNLRLTHWTCNVRKSNKFLEGVNV